MGHEKIAGNGFKAWVAWKSKCRDLRYADEFLKDCVNTTSGRRSFRASSFSMESDESEEQRVNDKKQDTGDSSSEETGGASSSEELNGTPDDSLSVSFTQQHPGEALEHGALPRRYMSQFCEDFLTSLYG